MEDHKCPSIISYLLLILPRRSNGSQKEIPQNKCGITQGSRRVIMGLYRGSKLSIYQEAGYSLQCCKDPMCALLGSSLLG